MNLIIQCTKVKLMRRIKLCQQMESSSLGGFGSKTKTDGLLFFLAFFFFSF